MKNKYTAGIDYGTGKSGAELLIFKNGIPYKKVKNGIKFKLYLVWLKIKAVKILKEVN